MYVHVHDIVGLYMIFSDFPFYNTIDKNIQNGNTRNVQKSQIRLTVNDNEVDNMLNYGSCDRDKEGRNVQTGVFY